MIFFGALVTLLIITHESPGQKPKPQNDLSKGPDSDVFAKEWPGSLPAGKIAPV